MPISATIENYEKFQQRIKSFSEQDRWLIDHAYQSSKYGHRKQIRSGGQRYFEHTRGVALIVLDEFKSEDPDLIIGSLIHDEGEDTSLFGNPTKLTYSEWKRQAHFLVSRIYNPTVAEMFIAVTRPHIDLSEVYTKEQADELGAKNLAEASLKAKKLKMADRLYNLRDMEGVEATKRDKKFEETVKKYFPVFETARSEAPEITEYALGQMRMAMARWGFEA